MQAHIWDELICSQTVNDVLCYVIHSCPTLRDPHGSSVHGSLQARVLEGVAIPSSRGSSWPRELASLLSPAFCGRFFINSATWEAQWILDFFLSDVERFLYWDRLPTIGVSLRSRRGITQWLVQGPRICLPMQMEDMQVWFPGWEDPLEEERATHCSNLAWKIPWTEEPGTLQSMGL